MSDQLVAVVLVSGIATGCFYALVALGLQVTYSTIRELNFAQGDLVVGGMFAMWTLTAQAGLSPWVALLLLLPLGFVLGALFELVVFRPLAGRPLLVSALGPVAAGVCLRGLYLLLYGSSGLAVAPLLRGKPLTAGAAIVPLQDVFVVLGVGFCVATLYVFMRFTWTGQAMRAAAQNRQGATVVGIDLRRISWIAVGISGAISAFGGGLMAPVLGVSFNAGLDLTVVAFTAAVVGGLDSALGVALGGLVIGLTTAVVAGVGLAAYTSTGLLVVLLLAMLRRPLVMQGATAE